MNNWMDEAHFHTFSATQICLLTADVSLVVCFLSEKKY